MSTRRSILLWLFAFLLMATAAVYQRLSGPTHPRRGSFQAGGQIHRYRLLRSQETTAAARIVVPDPGLGTTGTLVYRRFPTSDPWTSLAMERVQERGRPGLAARLPLQPPAGKVEYAVRLTTSEGTVDLPADGPVVLRYKGTVSTALLVCHVACMFFGMLFGVRAWLGALFEPNRLRIHTFLTLGLLTLGGMILGPFVQKAAFGAYWTGWPLGGDLTDDKTALLWLAWVIAAGIVAWLKERRPGFARAAVVAATAAMLAVYLVPHSARGSQLDYGKGQVQTGK